MPAYFVVPDFRPAVGCRLFPDPAGQPTPPGVPGTPATWEGRPVCVVTVRAGDGED